MSRFTGYTELNECNVITLYNMSAECLLSNIAGKTGTTRTLSLKITGGTPPYNITWFNSDNNFIANTSTISNLSAGTYTAVIQDYWGDYTATTTCVVPKIDCITTNLNINATYECITDIDGHLTGQATLNLNPKGGTPPYTYIGSINGTPTTITDGMTVNNGDYIAIEMTDYYGCLVTSFVDINDCPPYDPSPIPSSGSECSDLYSATTIDVTCNLNGLQTISNNGGQAHIINYGLSWIPNNLPLTITTNDILSTRIKVRNLISNNQYVNAPYFYNANPFEDFTNLIDEELTFNCTINEPCETDFSRVLRLEVDISMFILTADKLCNICGTGILELPYRCSRALAFTSTTVSLTNVTSECFYLGPPEGSCESLSFFVSLKDLIINGTSSAFTLQFDLADNNLVTILQNQNSFNTQIESYSVNILNCDNGTVSTTTFIPTSSSWQFPSPLVINGYADPLNRVSTIEFNVNIVLSNGCIYNQTFELIVDGNGGITDDGGGGNYSTIPYINLVSLISPNEFLF